MNYINTIESYYLRADASIDIVLLSSIKECVIVQNVVYIYNDQGIDFRIFGDFNDLMNYLRGDEFRTLAEFESEEDLVYYLKRKYEINIKGSKT